MMREIFQDGIASWNNILFFSACLIRLFKTQQFTLHFSPGTSIFGEFRMCLCQESSNFAYSRPYIMFEVFQPVSSQRAAHVPLIKEKYGPNTITQYISHGMKMDSLLSTFKNLTNADEAQDFYKEN
uniref:Uncharacterized protein n=1 Tax=Arion vulgaris TaxID=1028688 RepID=A0A0B7AIA5_9EUPU